MGDQSFRYLTVDEMKSLGDDSMNIDVTRDERATERMDMSFDREGETRFGIFCIEINTAGF